MANVEQH